MHPVRTRAISNCCPGRRHRRRRPGPLVGASRAGLHVHSLCERLRIVAASSVANGASADGGLRLLYCGGKEPLFIAALAFSSGIVAADLLWRSPLVWLLALALPCSGILVVWKRAPELAYPLALVAVFAAGAFYLQAFDAAQKTPPDLQAFETGEGEVIVPGMSSAKDCCAIALTAVAGIRRYRSRGACHRGPRQQCARGRAAHSLQPRVR